MDRVSGSVDSTRVQNNLFCTQGGLIEFIYIYIYMGHLGARASCFKYVHFAYNYAYPRVYIPKIRIPNSYIPKICIPKIHIPGIHIPNIYIYPEYIYICTFTYLRYIFQKNNISKVYIPHLCLLSMCKVIHILGYVQNITYLSSMTE
jgi:hypothetical protein